MGWKRSMLAGEALAYQTSKQVATSATGLLSALPNLAPRDTKTDIPMIMKELNGRCGDI
jgi:hypothetical protein